MSSPPRETVTISAAPRSPAAERAVRPVSAVLAGQYGRNGLALSRPSLVGRKGGQEILEMPLSSGERAALSAAAEQMREAIESLKL